MTRGKPEATSRSIMLDALDIEVRRAADMPEELRARILANLPSAEEVADNYWNDEN